MLIVKCVCNTGFVNADLFNAHIHYNAANAASFTKQYIISLHDLVTIHGL